MKAKWEALDMPCLSHGDEAAANAPAIDCRILEPYAPFARSGSFKRLFGKAGEMVFNPRMEGKHFDEYLPFNAKPLYFTGTGSPVILSLIDAGQPRILCGIDLNQYENEPEAWLLRIELGEYLKQHAASAPQSAYFYGAVDSNVAAMLDDVRCQYEVINKNQLMNLLNQPQRHLLIVDGASDLGWLKGIGRNNFSNVVVMNIDKAPNLFAHQFRVTGQKAFHLRGGDKAHEMGVYGNSLYGLDSGNEDALSPSLLQDNKPSGEIIFGLCDIDWRMWNNNAEYLKTAAILKSEKTDNRTFAALSCHHYAGSNIYFSQLSLSTQSRKAKHLLVRLLSSLKCGIDLAENNELDELLYSGLYSNKMTAMLYKPLAADEKVIGIIPGLNRIENGRAWTVLKQGKRSVSGALAIFAYSPQDRTDFLLNPDTIDMSVNAEKDVAFYLNDELQAHGTAFSVTSLAFKAGWNKLVFHCPEGQPLPDIRFKRSNERRLDLKFGVYDSDVIPQNMQKTTLFSQDQPNHLQDAVSGREKQWRSSTDQHNGIDIGVSFQSPITCKALYFSSATGSKRDIYTPYRFKILAGDCMDSLKEVYISQFEDRMYYSEGRVFIRLDDVTASCFKLVLTDNALKPWFVSSLTLLS